MNTFLKRPKAEPAELLALKGRRKKSEFTSIKRSSRLQGPRHPPAADQGNTANYQRRPALSAFVSLSSFRRTMPLGQFLFDYLYRCGVRHCFGIPGDFALPTFAWLEKSKIQSITMTHEPGAGFAADAYSRINGIGLVCVTYCVGGLNVLNAIAGAYAEKSPVVVVSGAPGRKDREKDPLLQSQGQNFRHAAPRL